MAKVSIMQRVKAQLDQLPPGALVGYADFVQEPTQFAAVAAALSRLSKAGEITRFAKGQYYRPIVAVLEPFRRVTRLCWRRWVLLRGNSYPTQPG